MKTIETMTQIERRQAELVKALAVKEKADEDLKLILLRYLDEQKKNEPLWTVRDAAEYLAVSESQVREMARSGKLKCRRIESSLRFEPDDVRRFGLDLKERS